MATIGYENKKGYVKNVPLKTKVNFIAEQCPKYYLLSPFSKFILYFGKLLVVKLRIKSEEFSFQNNGLHIHIYIFMVCFLF